MTRLSACAQTVFQHLLIEQRVKRDRMHRLLGLDMIVAR